ncbi:SusF/SusE family outer membrane protein [Roseivirga sp. E12]|uniref:SusF/SusE family outer membrane protein n=1 Tax=Roseivirga sp. E12 TaxID=2819237 RepID=UPI001ABC6FB3|nr:SusF/SusE family outer membrane protein [Roseivirga sp. E12]MBO3698505.1 SusF/SusE family outer membrane protein [Roseivirga sp. E12]
MKKLLYTMIAMSLLTFAITSCDNGNADFDVVDVAPVISIADPGNVIQGQAVNIEVSFTDGSENLSQSTLASATYDLSNGTTSVASGSFTVTGRTASGTVSVSGGLAAGDYTLSVTAVDSNGNSGTETFGFAVTSDFSVGIIGSATPTGWDSDTDLSFVTGTQYEVTIALTAGDAKFRANDDWGTNWGDTAFPTGTGTQDGANIPIATAGTYLVTFDTSTGAYTFTAQ